MFEAGLISTSRLGALAAGRGGVPTAEEWPLVGALLLVVALIGTRMLMQAGLTLVESVAVAGLSPFLVLVDAPLGEMSAGLALAANLTGAVVPAAVGVKVLLERRVGAAEALLLVSVGVVVSYFSSHVEPSRGVLLHYRIPALAVGFLAAGLLYRRPKSAGASAFAAGGLGVIIGADVFRLPALAAGGGAGRIVLGGAGLLDGIFLVAVLAGFVGYVMALVLRAVADWGRPVRTSTKP